MEKENKNDSMLNQWEDLRTVNENYSADSDIELYCEDLGKLRLAAWAVI